MTLRRTRMAILGGALGIAVLAGCGGGSDTIATGSTDQTANSQATESSETVAAASSGGSLIQVDVPIPSEQTFFDVATPPPHWPAFIGVPETLDTTQGFFLDQPTQNGRTLSATFVHADGLDFGAGVVDQVLAMGFETELNSDAGEGRFVVLRNGDQEFQITYDPTYAKIVIIS